MTARSAPGDADTGEKPVEVTRTVRLKNPAGLHARPCHAIASTAIGFESELTIVCGGTKVNGKSILELMTLCAPCHAELQLSAQGRDAGLLIERLTKMVEAGFDEMD